MKGVLMPSMLHMYWLLGHVVNFILRFLNHLVHFISVSSNDVLLFTHPTTSIIPSFHNLLLYMGLLLYLVSLILFSLPFYQQIYPYFLHFYCLSSFLHSFLSIELWLFYCTLEFSSYLPQTYICISIWPTKICSYIEIFDPRQLYSL